ncbi:AP2 domain-containing protein [Paucilactobacillus vaccinostercus]|uniref:AP2 domain-containing protein n=1 Tax=Paucilactobacillus vaccinostercus TaxID=176291 RepID=UPI0007099811|nr:AP2 domain-containing protein [Paucilactobacillus vaccinostercus]
MSKVIDLTGKRFGKLVVVGRETNWPANGTFWKCQCDCGTSRIVNGWKLRTGETVSCGCSRRKKARDRAMNPNSKFRKMSLEKMNQDSVDGTRLKQLSMRVSQHSSKYKGVSFHKSSGMWTACIKFQQHKRHLGTFSTEQEAAAAYITEAKRLFDPVLIANGREPLSTERYFKEGY